ncbi:MAG: type IV pili methyl-accepting chemotaxis transducer N-terminal domain-containing protein [Rhodobacteraceae bacterium]|nr:type IV pili methyl-accepting chemotaxis transducer N-terminal domain-containing protein [Paracoccaceae bacterium]
MLKVRFLPSFVAALALSLQPVSVQAQDNGSISVFERIDIAGAMSTSTQRMAKLACFIMEDINAEVHREELQAALQLFDSMGETLLEGDVALGLAAETSTRVKNAMGDVMYAWPVFRDDMIRVANGEGIDPGWMAKIDLYSLDLLEKTKKLKSRIVSVYGESFVDVPMILTQTVEIAKRQYMRMEKAAKESCLIGAGVDPAANRVNLEQTAAVFSATLDALIDGYPGLIMPAPSSEIAEKLVAVRLSWQEPAERLSRLVSGEEVEPSEHQNIGERLEELSQQMVDIARIYKTIFHE